MNNPPAFPMAMNESTSSCSPTGMYLRDWFAGMALQGYSGNPEFIGRTVQDDAKWAYQAADAMLAERTKSQEK